MRATAIYADCPEGRFSLIWGVGFGLFWTFVWGSPPGGPWQFAVWFLAWWGVSLPFAISGLRRGDLRNRIYAGISVINFALTMFLLLHYGGHGE